MAETRDSLTDGDLQSEIELVGDLVVAATYSDGPLPQSEIDRLLGVEGGGKPRGLRMVEATHETHDADHADDTHDDDFGADVKVRGEAEAADEVAAADGLEAGEVHTPDAGR
jgi:hypothetical protein